MKYARTEKFLLIAALSLAVATPGALFAQEGGGVRGTFSFDQSFEYSDNKRLRTETIGDTFTPITNLGFALASETAVDRFRFSLGAGIEKSFGKGAVGRDDDLRVSRKEARLDYTRFGANARLSFDAQLSEREVADDFEGFIIDGEFDPTALIVDRGDVRRAFLGITLETGINSPFGFELRLRNRDREYTESQDPDLTDQTRRSIDAVGRFRVRQSTAIRAVAGYSDLTDENIVTTRTFRQYAGVGVEGETAGGISITGDVTYDEAEVRDEFFGNETQTGYGFQFDIIQARTNGSFGLAASSRIDPAGRRTQVAVSRDVDLPTGGFGFSLGVADQDGDDQAVIGSLDYRRAVPLGQISASILRQPQTNIDVAEINTSINLGLRRALTQDSSFGATFRFGSSSRQFLGDEDNPARATLGLSYSRELTQDWGITAGYELTQAGFQGGNDQRTRNTVFFRIGRDFDFGF